MYHVRLQTNLDVSDQLFRGSSKCQLQRPWQGKYGGKKQQLFMRRTVDLIKPKCLAWCFCMCGDTLCLDDLYPTLVAGIVYRSAICNAEASLIMQQSSHGLDRLTQSVLYYPCESCMDALMGNSIFAWLFLDQPNNILGKSVVLIPGVCGSVLLVCNWLKGMVLLFRLDSNRNNK